MEENDGECLLQPLNPKSLCFSRSQTLFTAQNQLCLFISANLSVLMALGLLSFRRLAQRVCLVERELVKICSVSMGTLSARRDNVLAGQAGCALGMQISNLSSSRISHPLSEMDALLSGCISLSQSALLSESSVAFTFSSLA
ncbi:hypothetical protein HKD37_18G050298 [Glycine soja]